MDIERFCILFMLVGAWRFRRITAAHRKQAQQYGVDVVTHKQRRTQKLLYGMDLRLRTKALKEIPSLNGVPGQGFSPGTFCYMKIIVFLSISAYTSDVFEMAKSN